MADNVTLARRVFSHDDQLLFAQLSGDWNPVHMDIVAARRTTAGAPVVHGVNLLLWALEEAVSHRNDQRLSLTGISARFARWVYVGDEAELVQARSDAHAVNVRIVVNGMAVVTAKLLFGDRYVEQVMPPIELPSYKNVAKSPATPEFSTLKDTVGFLGFASIQHELANRYPSTAKVLGSLELAGVACSTRLVGMVCPGLNSIFSGLKVVFSEEARRERGLHYAVKSVDERFRAVSMDVNGAGMLGTIDTFARVPPVSQPTIVDISTLVAPQEFSGSHALVIGGSRGLGEFTAKAIAAGGGKVTITYALGAIEAERVAMEINEWGGDCRVSHFDIRLPAASQLKDLTMDPTHMYFFASNPIFRAKGRVLEWPLFDEFATFYLKGFYDLCIALKDTAAQSGIRVFYPSSVSVEARPDGMSEYSMVKAAGEVMCKDLSRMLPGLTILVQRLPRLLTDQTASIVPIKEESASDVLLPIIRMVQNNTVK